MVSTVSCTGIVEATGTAPVREVGREKEKWEEMTINLHAFEGWLAAGGGKGKERDKCVAGRRMGEPYTSLRTTQIQSAAAGGARFHRPASVSKKGVHALHFQMKRHKHGVSTFINLATSRARL